MDIGYFCKKNVINLCIESQYQIVLILKFKCNMRSINYQFLKLKVKVLHLQVYLVVIQKYLVTLHALY